MLWFVALLCLALYTPFAEYVVHRWLMHRPTFGDNAVWRNHAIEHHAKSRFDINIDLPPHSAIIAATPLLVFCLWLGWPWAVVVAASAALYAHLWSVLHACYHDLAQHWLAGQPFYEEWRRHHMVHHDDPDTNFGAIFLFTDRLFGTRMNPPAV